MQKLHAWSVCCPWQAMSQQCAAHSGLLNAGCNIFIFTIHTDILFSAKHSDLIISTCVYLLQIKLALLLPHSIQGWSQISIWIWLYYQTGGTTTPQLHYHIYVSYSLYIPTTINEPHLACIIIDHCGFENSHIHKPLQNNREHNNTASLFCWVPYTVHKTTVIYMNVGINLIAWWLIFKQEAAY